MSLESIPRFPGGEDMKAAVRQGKPPMDDVSSSGMMSYWTKEPYYMAKWTYFHRPSVWNRMGGTRGFEWHGLYGFKSLMGGSAGIGYQGGVRNAPRAIEWAMGAGGRGLMSVGKAFGGASAATAGRGLPSLVSSPIGALGNTIENFATGFGGLGPGAIPGGVAGGIRAAGGSNRVAGAIESIFGGTVTGAGSVRALSKAGMTSPHAMGVEAAVGREVGRRASVRHLLSSSARADLADDILLGLGPTYRSTMRGNVMRSIAFRGGARLMAAGAVVSNVALFGGVLAKLAQAGTRYIGEAAVRFRMDDRMRRLEFGGGVDPFPSAGSLTERRRALQALQGSQLNGRRFIGQEASLMHE